MSTCMYALTRGFIAFLGVPKKNDGYEETVDVATKI
jgi:hypothetical protein